MKIEVNINRDRRESGQMITVTALAPSGRILGVVEVLIPLMPNFPISERVGKEGEEKIIETAKELAELVAKAVQAEPVRA